MRVWIVFIAAVAPGVVLLGQLKELENQISLAMRRDQFRLRQRLNRLKQKHKSTKDSLETGHAGDEVEGIRADIERSVQLRNTRAEKVPSPSLDSELPIAVREQEIIDAIREHQVVVVAGATGSGKSTQLPLIAMRAGFGTSGMIGHTQPRRIAARGVANRIAQQLGSPLGSEVGFKIRFADQTDETTYVKLMTDGILLAETRSDRFLENYDLIIVDEAHERSLNIDFLLGFLKRILSKRPDLRLIITSATIDTERFARHFSNSPPTNPIEDVSTPIDSAPPDVPIINVEGRTYPVEIQYRPIANDAVETTGSAAEDHLLDSIREMTRNDNGDILVFLPTENDIRSAHKKLRSQNLPGPATEILPLYARLSTAQQNAIFSPGSKRRIVLATNVAESSITVPRIRFVIDSGMARMSLYSPRSKVQRLPIQPISQASADQRAGRCGRIGPGICVRLYSQDDYESRPEFTVPEIRRTNLASVILQTLSLKLGKIDEFPFLDPPRPDSIRDGFKTLFEIGAVDHHRRLTPLGRQLARLPVDPRIGRMLVAAADERCLAEILVIASALEIQDPRVRPAEKQAAADAAHQKFVHEQSDFLTLLNLWDFVHQLKSDLSRGKFKKALEQNFLSYSLVRQWQDIHRQLRSMVIEQKLIQRPKIELERRQNNDDAIHRSLMTGLLAGIAVRGDRHEYTGAGGIQFHLWPGSGLFDAKPQWIMAAELVETTRRYGRTIAKINPEWIEPLAEHLSKTRYTDPRWSQKNQTVVASEHISLWGLPVVAGRQVRYGRIDPAAARDIFIESALTPATQSSESHVGEDYLHPGFDFLDHNRWVIQQIENEAAKTRRRDLVIDAYSVEAFYQSQLPNDIFDRVSLAQALKNNETLDSRLRLTRNDLIPSDQSEQVDQQFPDRTQIGSMEIPVEYKFSPGSDDDGATIKIPVAGIGQIDEVQSGWLIPGLLEPRIVALIRSLPKSIRRNLVPAPETAKRVATEITFGQGNMLSAVAEKLTRIGGQPIRPDMFNLAKMDDHLQVNLQVVADDGEIVAQGRSLSAVRGQLGPKHQSSLVEVEQTEGDWHQDGLVDWTWGDFPKETPIVRGSTTLSVYPTIVDAGDSVNLRYSDSAAASRQQTKQGLTRLFQLQHRKHLKSQINWLPILDQHSIALSQVMPSSDIKSQLVDLLVRVALVEREKIPRTEADFRERQSSAVEKIGIATQDIAKWLPKLATSLQQVMLEMEEMPARFSETKSDIQEQLDELFREDFLTRTPWNWLVHYPRYLEAIHQRIDKRSSTSADKEAENIRLVKTFWERFVTSREHHLAQGIVNPELDQFRWMIEEYRVSLFAQNLGTSVKVSDIRLEKQWNKIQNATEESDRSG